MFRRTQEGAMMDTCVIMAFADGAINDYGNPSNVYTDGSPTICGYKPTGTREVQQGNETVLIDAELRLPIATVIKPTDQVRLIKRFGESITALTFAVVGQPARGPSGLVVKLARVTDA